MSGQTRQVLAMGEHPDSDSSLLAGVAFIRSMSHGLYNRILSSWELLRHSSRSLQAVRTSALAFKRGNLLR